MGTAGVCLASEAKVSDVLSISCHLPLQGSRVSSVMSPLLCRPHLPMAFWSLFLLFLMVTLSTFSPKVLVMLRMQHTHLTPCSSQMLSLCLWYLLLLLSGWWSKRSCPSKSTPEPPHMDYLCLLSRDTSSHSPSPWHSLPTHFHISYPSLDHDFLGKSGSNPSRCF